tara:strand:- start:267 stop:719 length:453 start_codon:yes stop_codon:yes gene_type:complete
MMPDIQKDFEKINTPRSFQTKATKELENIGLLIFKDNKSNQIIEISGNKNKNVRDSHLKFIGRLKEITDLSLEETQITEEGIRYIAKLPKLEWLNLYKTKVNNRSLKEIAKIKSLKLLPIGSTKITDEGITHLATMTQLEYLGLRGNFIT